MEVDNLIMHVLVKTFRVNSLDSEHMNWKHLLIFLSFLSFFFFFLRITPLKLQGLEELEICRGNMHLYQTWKAGFSFRYIKKEGM